MSIKWTKKATAANTGRWVVQVNGHRVRRGDGERDVELGKRHLKWEQVNVELYKL